MAAARSSSRRLPGGPFPSHLQATKGSTMQKLSAALLLPAVLALSPDARAERVGLGGVSITAAAGVGGFTGGLNASSRVGPTWTLQTAAHPWPLLSFEGGYDGSYTPLSEPVLGFTGGGLMRGTVFAMAQVGPQLGPVRPFAAAGVGGGTITWTHSPGFMPRDLIAELPVALGVNLERGWLTGGVRASYRILFNENFLQAFDMPVGQGGFLSMTASLGGRF